MTAQDQYVAALHAVESWEDPDSRDMIADALDHLQGDSDDGDAARVLEDAAHEWADSDERVIYYGKALAFCAGPEVGSMELTEAADMIEDAGMGSPDLLELATRTAFFVLRARYETDIQRFLDALDGLG